MSAYARGVTIASLQERQSVITLSQEIKKTNLELREKEDFLQLRLFWGRSMAYILGGMLIYNALIVIAIGCNWISFKSTTVTSIVIGQNFVEVIGLVTIVLKALFPSESKR
jgi:hypothetical protein